MPKATSTRASMQRRALSHVFVLGLALIELLVTPAAVQAQNDHAPAEALFQQGRELMRQGRYNEACMKFEVSHKIDPAVGTLLNLGYCRQMTGHIASAWKHMRQVIAMADRHRQFARKALASKLASELEGQLPYLLVIVPENVRVPGLVVTCNGVVVDKMLWSQALPADPGLYTIEARAPGYKPQKIRVAIPPGHGVTLATVTALEACTELSD